MTSMVVSQLWRFPVKSMGGQRVDEVRVDGRGLHADRLWAVREVQRDVTASARKVPALLGCVARYRTEPGPDAGPGNAPEVVITLPDGSETTSADPDVHRRISEVVGREMRLVALPPLTDTTQHRLSMQQSLATYSVAEVRKDFGLDRGEALPDTSVFTPKQVLTLARYSTPPGTFADLAPIHLMSTRSMASLSDDGSGYDVRRFRPNVLIEIDGAAAEFPEAGWVGAQLRIGTSRMHVTNPTVRCVMPSRPQPGIELDKALTRRLADRTDRFLGVYADVVAPGLLRVGDEVLIDEAAAPNVLARSAATLGRTATRGVQRLLEVTVLREKG